METVATKITKKQYFEMIKEAVAGNDELVEFCDAQIAQLDARAEKAAERARIKREESDALYAKVLSLVTDEPQTRDDITELVNQDSDEELTAAKVGARLSNLVRDEKITKVNVKTEDGKKKVAYILA